MSSTTVAQKIEPLRILFYISLSEGDNRPLKSLSELREPLTLAGIDNTPQQLSLVLDIFIGSGLVFEVPEGLWHSLSASARVSSQSGTRPAAAWFDGSAKGGQPHPRALTEDQLQKALAAQSATLAEATLARQKAKLAEIEALISASRSLRLSGNGLDALAKALQAASQFSIPNAISSSIPSAVTSAVPSAESFSFRDAGDAMPSSGPLWHSREKCSRTGHRDWILAVDWNRSFSLYPCLCQPDGTFQTVDSAGAANSHIGRSRGRSN